MSGRLDAIWIKRAHRGPMDPVPQVLVRAGRGLAGNANQGGRRAVTLIDRSAWLAATDAVGTPVAPDARRANLLVSGISLEHSRGRTLRVGACTFRINGETRPCERMDEAHPGLRAALEPAWRGGAYAEPLDDGTIEVGAVVAWTDVDAR